VREPHSACRSPDLCAPCSVSPLRQLDRSSSPAHSLQSVLAEGPSPTQRRLLLLRAAAGARQHHTTHRPPPAPHHSLAPASTTPLTGPRQHHTTHRPPPAPHHSPAPASTTPLTGPRQHHTTHRRPRAPHHSPTARQQHTTHRRLRAPPHSPNAAAIPPCPASESRPAGPHSAGPHNPWTLRCMASGAVASSMASALLQSYRTTPRGRPGHANNNHESAGTVLR
jgi:hypothetical protein